MVKLLNCGFKPSPIVECRGPLGPGGVNIYRIRNKPSRACIEVREDQRVQVEPDMNGHPS